MNIWYFPINWWFNLHFCTTVACMKKWVEYPKSWPSWPLKGHLDGRMEWGASKVINLAVSSLDMLNVFDLTVIWRHLLIQLNYVELAFPAPHFFCWQTSSACFFLPAAGTASGTGTCAGRFFQRMLFFFTEFSRSHLNPLKGTPINRQNWASPKLREVTFFLFFSNPLFHQCLQHNVISWDII